MRNPPRRRVTTEDIAKAAGVSRATVSYVLNDTPGKVVSERTRDLVRKTAAELGHYPSASARSLRRGRSDIVLALVRDFAIGYIADGVLSRLDVALAEHGYLLLTHRYEPSVRPIQQMWGLVTPAAIVAMGGLALSDDDTEHIRASPAAFVGVTGILPNARAGEMQVEHLHELGHRRLGYAFPTAYARALVASERLDGSLAACEALGLAAPDVQPVDVDDPESALHAVDAWLATDPRPTAIVAHNDEIAIVVRHAMSMRGIVAGRDMALIGVDDIPTARFDLSTIEIDLDVFGGAVADRLLGVLEGTEERPREATDFLRLHRRSTT